MSGDLLHMYIGKFIRGKKMQNLACHWDFAFGKLEIFVHYYFTNSEHTLENAEMFPQLNTCICIHSNWLEEAWVWTREFRWTYCREPENAIGYIPRRNCLFLRPRLFMCTLQPQDKVCTNYSNKIKTRCMGGTERKPYKTLPPYNMCISTLNTIILPIKILNKTCSMGPEIAKK